MNSKTQHNCCSLLRISFGDHEEKVGGETEAEKLVTEEIRQLRKKKREN